MRDYDETGDYVVPNVLSPRDLVFRPDIGHKLYHQLVFIIKSRPSTPLMHVQSCVPTPGVSK